MSLPTTANWEVRITGNANNGGGFNNRIPGTSIDYSQQNASQLSKADLACAAGSTTVTSATNGFTPQMVGNYMRIRAGANFTVGFYEIVQFNGVGSIELDRVPVTGIGANGVAEVGGAQIQISAAVVSDFIAGNTIHVKTGTYAAHPNIALTDSGQFTVKAISGYDVVRGDAPIGNNRPLLQLGVNKISYSGVVLNLEIKNLRIESSNTKVIDPINTNFNLFLKNVKITHTAIAGGPLYCLYGSAGGNYTILDCEFSGTAGAISYGINPFGTALTVLNSHFHDLTSGIVLAGGSSGLNVLFCIFNRMAQSAIVGSEMSSCIINNTFANCGRSGFQNVIFGIIGGDLVINNTFSDCITAGMETLSDPFICRNNNFYGCGVPVLSSAFRSLRLCDNNTYVNPQFVAPGSNYALQRTSGLIDRAFSMRLGV